MFDVLKANRTISRWVFVTSRIERFSTWDLASKAVSHAMWCPNIGRAHVAIAKGIHFTSMGHSVLRQVLDENGASKVQKCLELLPEEAMYLVERGSLFYWKDSDMVSSVPGIEGVPMTVQQIHTEMVGLEGLTLEKFQVCLLFIDKTCLTWPIRSART